MKTTYLSEFEKMAKQGVAYIPVGTIEWHGSHLPIETDFLIAQKICEIIAEENPGYILPPFYLGGYDKGIINGVEMRGMDRKLGKKLLGNLYFLDPELLGKTLRALIHNLKDQGFKKIIVLTGHGGSGQINVLSGLTDDEVLFINPYESAEVHHADEGETSVFWACYPDEEAKARAIVTPENDDLSNYRQGDPYDKSSMDLGRNNLDKMVKFSKEKVEEFINLNEV